MRDQYNVNQAAAVGPKASVSGNISLQSAGLIQEVDLTQLKNDLEAFRMTLKARSSGSAEEDLDIATIAAAEVAAGKKDRAGILSQLSCLGAWGLKLGKEVTTDLLAKVLVEAT